MYFNYIETYDSMIKRYYDKKYLTVSGAAFEGLRDLYFLD